MFQLRRQETSSKRSVKKKNNNNTTPAAERSKHTRARGGIKSPAHILSFAF